MRKDSRKLSPEHFGREAFHLLLEILVEQGGVQPVEQIILGLLVLDEELQVLEDLLLNRHGVLIPGGANYYLTPNTQYRRIVLT